MSEPGKREVAVQAAITVAAGLGAYAGPGAGALAAGAGVLALAGWQHVIGGRRLDNNVDTLLAGAEAFGAETVEEFVGFLTAVVSDPERQELLARTLTIAQDTAMRDKRRALGRALAQAASDTGTKVDPEMLFIRVLADLDEPHIKVLRIMRNPPPAQGAVNLQMQAIGQVVRQWHASDIIDQDPGLADVIYGLLPVLARHLLISGGYDVITMAGHEEEYTITEYGEFFLERLAEPSER
jgi:hypothetical protein